MADPRDWRPDPTAAQFWQALRELPEACSLGLLMPRFLLRLPYGEETSPAETFPFEEISGTPAHDEYLWGNPAFAAACLLGQAFSEDGWRMRPGTIREIAGLPLHSYQHDGEGVLQPCGEVWLTDRAADSILERGLMPLVSARNSDSVLLVRFQSLADPKKPLAGRW
jgi:type VI secretion system protein ImpC